MIIAVFKLQDDHQDDSVLLQMLAEYRVRSGRIYWYPQLVIDAQPFADGDIRTKKLHGMSLNVDGCQFFDACGIQQKNGNLMDIYFVDE